MNQILSGLRSIAACAALAMTSAAFAQRATLRGDAAFDGPSDIGGVSAAPASSSSIVAPVPVPSRSHPLTERWLDLTTLSHTERFRSAFAVGGYHDFDNMQARNLIEGDFKFDEEGKYKIGFRASSGRYFNWAFSNYTDRGFVPRIKTSAFQTSFFTPAEQAARAQAALADPAGILLLRTGIKSNGWEFYMRELYMSATPVKPVTVEFGSMGIERGYSTEITSFDDDGYVSGERVRLHDKKHLFVDEISFTNGFFGDFATPNLFERGSSLENFNYRQVAAKKRLNDHLALSAEYTWQTDISTLREAAVVGTKPLKVIDGVRVEVYERVNAITFPGLATSPLGPIAPVTAAGGAGFAAAVEKKAGRLSGDFGFASVDQNYSVYANSRYIQTVAFAFNGDGYGVGYRPFMHAAFQVTPAISVFGFYTHEVGSERVVTLNQQGLNAGMNFNFKSLINTKKAIF